MGQVGCYDLHLYCDAPHHDRLKHGHWPSEFAGRDERDCFRQAREKGWVISPRGQPNPVGHGSGRAICPLHSGKPRGARDEG